jgi:DNA-directed RNA polymerase subunit RPC12/RpoP
VDCDRHFASSIEQRDTYWCPYCGAQRSWDCWFTPVQQSFLDDALAEDVLATAYQELEHVLNELALDSEGVIVNSPEHDRPAARPALLEPTVDLTTVPVPCHPGAKLKLDPGWSDGVRCHLCGSQAQSRRTALGRVRLQRREP